MSTSLRALGNHIVVEPMEQEEVTASGIIIPQTAKEKPQQGTVLAVGPGKKDDSGVLIPMEVKVNDVVLYAKYGGTEVKLGGNDTVLVLRESDILAVVE